MKGLDHVVLCVDDLDAAAESYRQLGFTVTPRAKHPFGTHNCLVQLNGFFLELLTVGEPDKIPQEQEGLFSFARFNQMYLSHREGCSMLVVDSNDFLQDNRATQEAGLHTYPPFEFTRKARLPDGEEVDVSFGLNFVSSDQMPMAGFFSCQQFQPQYFWNADYQRHDNAATEIIEVCVVSSNPRQVAAFLSGLARCDACYTIDGDVIIETVRGRIFICSPMRFEQRYETDAPDVSGGGQLAGFTIGVRQNPPEPVSVCGAAILFELITIE